MNFEIKQGDTLPLLECQILKADGTPQSLVGATVQFRMRSQNARPASTFVVDAPAAVIDDANGRVRYEWTPPDTAAPGSFAVEFVITFADGKKQTAPTSGYLPICIPDAGLPG